MTIRRRTGQLPAGARVVRVVALVTSTGIYALLFLPLHRLLGVPAAALGVLPVFLAGALFGEIAGVAWGSLVLFPLLLIQFRIAGDPSSPMGLLAASLTCSLVGGMVGRLRRYRMALEERQAQLGASNAELATALENLSKTQERMLQSEKMSAVGQLAGGVAHEINNPLGVILGFAQGMERRVPEGDALRLPVASIVREALRCRNLIQELLTFSRTAKKTTEEVDLNAVVRSTAVLLEARAKTQCVEVVQELHEPLPALCANKTQLQQVIVNLGTNAMDAMSGGGKLTLRTRLNGGGKVVLQVADSGTGIPEEVRARIFEPFFTTKEVGKGTGLGLSLVYEIIQQHQGNIAVESQPGKGTVMSVELPAAPVTVDTARAAGGGLS
ncbi:MAG: sensor histidine kinase [Myxococcaceae bacterium]